MITRAEAALARQANIRAAADRPSQRRSAPEPGSPARMSVRVRDLVLRSAGAGAPLQFDGYASVTNAGYTMYDMFGEYTEEVGQGAFASSLARADLDVPFVLQHDSLRRIARTTNGTLHLSEDDNGLHVLADLDPEDQDVQYITPKLRSGLVDEMSFKFRINAGEWSPDWETYRITDVDLNRGDVAIVGYGASPHTKGSGLALAETDVHEILRGLTPEQARTAMTELRVMVPPTGRDLVTEEETAARH